MGEVLHPPLTHPEGVDTAVVVAHSRGKDSTAMALRLKEIEPDQHYIVVCTPTGNELPEMFEHWRRTADLLGTPMMPLVAGNLVNEIHREKMIPNFRTQWCTRKLKIEPYQAFLGKLVKQYRRGGELRWHPCG